MIAMHEKQEIIIRYFRNGDGYRKIARDLGINRKTVKKYIKDYKSKAEMLNQPVDAEQRMNEIIDDIVATPTYCTQNRPKRKLSNAIISEVQTYLSSNKEKRQSGRGKQQLRKKDIYELLTEKGYDIGYTTICNLIRELDNRVPEAYIRQQYAPGNICEFDWGEVKIKLSKGYERYQLALFTSAFGNYRYGRLFKHQDTSSFQQSHAYFFEKVNGVYKIMVYDNTRVVIKKFVGFHEKEATDGLLKLSLYYNFSFRFCNLHSGHEKGHVERSVEYVRRKAFGRKDRFNSLKEANEYLEQVCDSLNAKRQKEHDNKTALALLKEEQSCLYPVKAFFECGEEFTFKADKYSTISYKTCRYSVPEDNVGKMVKVRVYPEKLICSDEDGRIYRHDRLHGSHEWSIKIEHYTNTLKRKPGALAGSVALAQLDSRLKTIYEMYFSNRAKEFIEIIEYLKQPSITIEKIESSIKKLQPCRVEDVTIDKIKILCERVHENPKQITNHEDEIYQQCKSQLILLCELLPRDENYTGESAEVL